MKILSGFKSVRTLFISLLLVTAQAAMNQAYALPRAFDANFTVAKGRMTLGNLHASLRYTGNQYQYRKSTKASGFAALVTGMKITENSNGRFAKNAIKPSNYLYNQSRRKKSRIEKIHFNGNKAVGSYKGKPFNLAVSANALDRGSVELALARDLAANKPRLVYPVVEKGKTKNLTFAKLGQEKIKTPAGTFNTIKLRVVRNNNKRNTTFWLAKELDYMPVKVRHNEKGDVITTVIKNFKM